MQAPNSSGPSTAVVQPPAQHAPAFNGLDLCGIGAWLDSAMGAAAKTQAAGYAPGTASLFLLGMGLISNPGSELHRAEGEDLALHIVHAPLEVYGHNALLGKGASHFLM